MNNIRYPRPDPVFEKYYHGRLDVIINIIKNYELVYKIFGNLEQYKKRSYIKNKNVILYSLITNEYSHKLELLESSLKKCREKFNNEQYESFCSRITNWEYDKSKSAFDEIITMYKITDMTEIQNIEYEPKVNDEKNCDIKIIYNNKEIFLELTFINESKINRNINYVFNKIAKYIYDKILKKSNLHVTINIDTTKLNYGNNVSLINKEKTLQRLRRYVDELHILELITSGIEYNKYKNERIDGVKESKELSMYEYYSKNYGLGYIPCTAWSNQILMKDMQESPFTIIRSSKNERNSVIVERGSNLLNPAFNELDKKAVLEQIKNKITKKIRQKQYKNNHPYILIISISNMDYDIDRNDYNMTNVIIRDALSNCKFISGIMISGQIDNFIMYFPNENANKKVDEEVINNLCKKIK